MKSIVLPLSGSTIKELRAGDAVSLTGTIYVGRDAAHQRGGDHDQRIEEDIEPLHAASQRQDTPERWRNEQGYSVYM